MNTLLERPAIPNTTTQARRLLLIAYNFPPVGGAGVQRPVKWVKNLRRFGWEVTVLTVDNPSVPVRDESLLKDIPEDVRIVRARTYEPDYQTKQGLIETASVQPRGIMARVKSAVKGLVKRAVKLFLQPDPQVLWVPNAIRAGRKILRELPHDAILVTAPAYSSFFIGTSLKRTFGLPLVLDFRDEWDMSGRYLENAQRDLISMTIQKRMQRFVLRRADAVVATTKASTANLKEKLDNLNKPEIKTVTVYNGFDAEDFDSAIDDTERRREVKANVQSAPAVFRLLYTGTLWNLTTIEPLVDAVLRLHATSPELVARLELVCVGRKTADQTTILERLRTTGCRLELIDYCEHSKVLEWLRSADALCLLLSDVPGAERVVPAKLFEYLANRREMLAIVPDGETAGIVRRYFPKGQIEPKEIDRIATWLKDRLEGNVDPDAAFDPSADIDEYSRTAQTQRLVELLDELVASGANRTSPVA